MNMKIKDIPQNATGYNHSQNETVFKNWCIYTTNQDGTTTLTFKLWFVADEETCNFDNSGKLELSTNNDRYYYLTINSALCDVIGKVCIKPIYDKNNKLGNTLNSMLASYNYSVLDVYTFLYCIFSYRYPRDKFIVKLSRSALDYGKTYVVPLKKCHLGIVTDINAIYISVTSYTSGFFSNSIKKIKSENLKSIVIPSNVDELRNWTESYDKKIECDVQQHLHVNHSQLQQMFPPGPPANSPVLQPGSQMHLPGPSNRGGSQISVNVLEPGFRKVEPGSINGGKHRYKKSRCARGHKKSRHCNTKRHRK